MADQVIFHVRDHGPGVPLEERDQIFERFVRGNDAIAGPHAGSGIGLAVVQSLMKAMGGDAFVTYSPGGGADFQLRVFVHKPSDDQPGADKLKRDSTKNRRLPQLQWFINDGSKRANH